MPNFNDYLEMVMEAKTGKAKEDIYILIQFLENQTIVGNY
jgi:hypothetical protein